MDTMRTGFRGRRGAALVIESVAQAVGAGMHPQLGKGPDQLSPDLSRTLIDRILTDAKGAVFSAFWVLPGLQNPSTTGPMVREAQRHLAQLILQPMAMLMAEEATAKLGTPVVIDLVRPMQAYDAGGKVPSSSAAPDTVSWLIEQYLGSLKFVNLSPSRKRSIRRELDWMREVAGRYNFKSLQVKHIEALMAK